jgi:hypothetical protein
MKSNTDKSTAMVTPVKSVSSKAPEGKINKMAG